MQRRLRVIPRLTALPVHSFKLVLHIKEPHAGRISHPGSQQLKKEKDIGKLAQQNSLKLEETGWFLRNAPQLPKVGELSELRSGEIELSAERPFPDKIYTQKDNAYILAFKDSQGADMEQFDKEKEQVTKQALAESRQQVLQRFVESLKAKAQIQVHPNALEES